MNAINKFLERIELDWLIFIPALLISLAGLVTMNSFTGDNYFFFRQSIWILIAVMVFVGASAVDWRFLRRTSVLVPLFLIILFLLASLFLLGRISHGAASWFSLGFAAFQPSDLAKLVLILILSKYFSRRHVEIGNVRHVFVSGIYAAILFVLVFLQPDFGGAIVIAGIWLGMVLVSGISKKHLAFITLAALVLFGILWIGVLRPYQKARILTFIHPAADIHGAGYNAYQSTIAVGSGELFGKGVGQGSQSKLQYLPEYQTDFIFAAFTEEWGFVGAAILLSLMLFLLYRMVASASQAATNFEALFALGVVSLFAIHVAIHAGMNMGIVPVTGIVFPLMSYGGSHLVMEWLALGMVSSMRRFSSARAALT